MTNTEYDVEGAMAEAFRLINSIGVKSIKTPSMLMATERLKYKMTMFIDCVLEMEDPQWNRFDVSVAIMNSIAALALLEPTRMGDVFRFASNRSHEHPQWLRHGVVLGIFKAGGLTAEYGAPFIPAFELGFGNDLPRFLAFDGVNSYGTLPDGLEGELSNVCASFILASKPKMRTGGRISAIIDFFRTWRSLPGPVQPFAHQVIECLAHKILSTLHSWEIAELFTAIAMLKQNVRSDI